jgi:hypothetical protein
MLEPVLLSLISMNLSQTTRILHQSNPSNLRMILFFCLLLIVFQEGLESVESVVDMILIFQKRTSVQVFEVWSDWAFM